MPPRSQSNDQAGVLSSDEEDEEDYRRGGYHRVKLNTSIGRYRVVRKLGWGHFSTVWLVQDEGGRELALKIQKSAKHYTEAAKDEIKILNQIKYHDPGAIKPVIHMVDSFEHVGPNGKHTCMVFEMLGDSLLKLIKAYDYHGIPLDVVRSICRHILKGLDYLHRQLEIIHTDLKPENILLTGKVPVASSHGKARTSRSPKDRAPAPGLAPPSAPPEGKIARALAEGVPLTKNQKKKLKKKQRKAQGQEQGKSQGASTGEAPPGPGPSEGSTASRPREETPPPDLGAVPRGCKIIDFGNACWTYHHFTSDIQTRQYRCPEVLLGAAYSTPADMWSLGCMVFELITGDYLFEPRSGKDYDRDEDHLALMQEALGKIPKGLIRGKHAREFFNSRGELRHIKKLEFWPIANVLEDKYGFPKESAAEVASFLNPMLCFDPERRVKAADALQHPFLRQQPEESGRKESPILITS